MSTLWFIPVGVPLIARAAYFAYVHDKVAERMSSMWKIAMDPYYAKEIASYALGDFLVAGACSVSHIDLSGLR